MFAILSRPVARRTADYAVRCIASKPPKVPKELPPSPPPPSAVPNLDILPQDAEVERMSGRTGAKSSADTLSSAEKHRRRVGGISAIVLAGLLGVQVAYMTRDWNESELKAKKWTVEDAPSSRWNRAVIRFKDFLGLFSEPPAPELLPPPLPPPHGKPYTLVLEIDDLLVTSTWDRQHGWRTAKRPGVDYFLAYLSQFYEVVIFTRQYQYTAEAILSQLDKFQFFIGHRLYRDSTRAMGGKTVKDLSFLNRDLSKVILLDTVPEHGSAQPENSIILPKWTGDPNDRDLVAMIPFLESLVIYKAPDVRPIISAYSGKNIPIEYAKKEAEAKQQHNEEWEKKLAQPNKYGSMFGLSNRSNSIPPTYLEARRKEAQQFYRDEQAYISRNRDQLEKMLQQEQDTMMSQAGSPSNFWEMLETLKNGPQMPPPPGSQPTIPEPSKTA